MPRLRSRGPARAPRRPAARPAPGGPGRRPGRRPGRPLAASAGRWPRNSSRQAPANPNSSLLPTARPSTAGGGGGRKPDDGDYERAEEQELRTVGENDSFVGPVEAANCVLKLANMAGDPHIDQPLASSFTQMVCRLCANLEAAADDVPLFRAFVRAVEEVASHALRGGKDANGEHYMTIALVDLLRSVCPGRECEYDRQARSEESRDLCEVLGAIRGETVDDRKCDAYTTAEIVDRNLQGGLAQLNYLRERPEAELKELLASACAPLARSLCALSFATLFDGQRLRAGAWVCKRFITHSCFKFENDLNAHLSGSISNASLQRMKAAICVFCAWRASASRPTPSWRTRSRARSGLRWRSCARKSPTG